MTHQCQSTIRVDRAVPSRAYPVSYRDRTDLSMATEDGSGHIEFRKCADFPSPRANAQRETRLHCRIINVACNTLWALSHEE